jgi:hypothetical protein
MAMFRNPVGHRDVVHEDLNTHVIVLEPARAWQLPTDLGMSGDVDSDSTYRWPVIGKRLAAALEEFTANERSMLASMLTESAPLGSRQ